MPKVNSASRLKVLLGEAAKKGGGGRAARQVWAEMFEIDPNENIRTDLAVMEHLLWICSEIDAVLDGMAKLQAIPAELYEPQLVAVLNALGPTTLAPEYQHVAAVL